MLSVNSQLADLFWMMKGYVCLANRLLENEIPRDIVIILLVNVACFIPPSYSFDQGYKWQPCQNFLDNFNLVSLTDVNRMFCDVKSTTCFNLYPSWLVKTSKVELRGLWLKQSNITSKGKDSPCFIYLIYSYVRYVTLFIFIYLRRGKFLPSLEKLTLYEDDSHIQT